MKAHSMRMPNFWFLYEISVQFIEFIINLKIIKTLNCFDENQQWIGRIDSQTDVHYEDTRYTLLMYESLKLDKY